MTTRLDISVGPVQGFVAQSRRTRDLWGSSYLLSFLSAHAMTGAQQAGGRVVQPVIDQDRLYCWVTGQREGNAPRLGSLPNHFVVEVDETGEAPRAIADATVHAFEDAWRQVCEPVWREYLEHACAYGKDTTQIWNRQVGTFWEVTWTAGSSDHGGGLLARRKRWRSHRPPDEHGDKCTVMHDLQELSGYVRSESSTSRQQQDRFWKTVRNRIGDLDLREDERLCAVAFVKRLFPRVASQAVGWAVDRSHWPSTVYVAAVPWIRGVIRAAPELARHYADSVVRSAARGALAERQPPFKGLHAADAGRFSNLDANWFHRNSVTSERRCPFSDGAASTARDELDRALKTISEARDDAGQVLRAPSSFYAMILADGDRLGKLVGFLGGDTVGRGLAAFTGAVPSVVARHDGVTVYAGGDDVLAMVPMPMALQCAASLAESYRSAFPDTGAEDATLSAAVLFAHVRLPLRAVLDEARRLLDAVAKDGNGRNSLAAGVLKPGGLHCQWATTWTRNGPADAAQVRAVDVLNDLVTHLKKNTADPGLSSALIYRIRETLTLLCGMERWQPGHWGAVDGFDIRALVRAEVLHSLTVRLGDGVDTRSHVLADSIWRLLGPSRAGQPGATQPGTREVGIDALLLARFLSDGGREENRG